ncbi:Cytochrome P450 [Venustampulla echinocandica]|uniref:Cytochrome P450 n=1 Tax=Venustampulla echinocandica TaxID=2656787 RepID=A0A370U1H5_9HELO|nr:Cytochrome P450 [Venustampulla echinocandica]RDL41626.1 Cytochrome P450 [Venustampulla echinocandica]
MALITLLTPNTIYVAGIVLLTSLFIWIYNHAFGTDLPKLAGIPELPGSKPFYGHLKVLGNDHASAFQKYGEEQKADIVQARLGNRRIVVLNSFEAAQDWFVRNASATIDRPLFYTFHGILSTSQGGTIGTAPWSDSAKRRRTAVGAVMTRPAIQKLSSMLDLESNAVIEDMFLASKECSGRTDVPIDPRIFFQRQALNLTLMLCYANRISGIDDPLLFSILEVAHSVSSFRSTNNNPQDYVPLLRYLPANERTKTAVDDRNRRDVWLDELLSKVQLAVDEGRSVPCLSEGLLKDKTNAKLTKEEIKSINVSLVSGGFETLSTTSIAGLSFLTTPLGLEIQERAYTAIMAVYSSPQDAWEKCVTEEAVPYMVALAREMLRYYAAIPLLPPRQTMTEFNWRGKVIPKGLSVYVNAQAVNHDKTAYGDDADEFRPERWLDGRERDQPGLPHHYSFGAGSRVCPAVALSNRVIYATFIRLIVSFKVKAKEGAEPVTDYVNYNEDSSAQTAMPKRYQVVLEERQGRDVLLGNIAGSKKRTESLGF